MWLKECPNCDQGLLVPMVSAEGTVILFCDSADCTWLDPESVDTADAIYPDTATWAVTSEIHLTPGKTREAAREDLPPAWRDEYDWNG